MLASEGDAGGTGATVSREERQTHQREQGAADGRGDRAGRRQGGSAGGCGGGRGGETELAASRGCSRERET